MKKVKCRYCNCVFGQSLDDNGFGGDNSGCCDYCKVAKDRGSQGQADPSLSSTGDSGAEKKSLGS